MLPTLNPNHNRISAKISRVPHITIKSMGATNLAHLRPYQRMRQPAQKRYGGVLHHMLDRSGYMLFSALLRMEANKELRDSLASLMPEGTNHVRISGILWNGLTQPQKDQYRHGGAMHALFRRDSGAAAAAAAEHAAAAADSEATQARATAAAASDAAGLQAYHRLLAEEAEQRAADAQAAAAQNV